jgi:hypothetical protein
MENSHELSSLISIEEIARLTEALDISWSRDTCYTPQQENWSEANKALGQCAVTVLVVHDRYGGTFAYDQSNDHYWNIFPDGSHHDFSRKQFPEGTVFSVTTTKQREDLLTTPGAIKAKTRERYLLLRDQVKKSLSSEAL